MASQCITIIYEVLTAPLCISMWGVLSFWKTLWVIACRLPELSSVRDREHSSSSQLHHPQASRPSQHMQQPQSDQLVQKLQQKLQGQEDVSGPTSTAASIDTALAASQPHTDHHSDRRHHKASHAHFADDDSNTPGDGVTERNESITAVRGAPRGEEGSHAEGTFWKRLDGEGSSKAATGWCPYIENKHVVQTQDCGMQPILLEVPLPSNCYHVFLKPLCYM